MSGLDRILSEINSRGKENADAVTAAAEKKAEKIRSDGQKKAQQTYDDLMEKYRSDIAREYANACAGAEASAKRMLLSCKVECVDKAVAAAGEKLASLNDAEYFKLIARLFEKHLRPQSCVIAFGERDLSRLPSDFESALGKIASQHGAHVSIAEKPVSVESGFILDFGDISENCSFSAILEAERDAVRDTAAAALFA